MQEYDIVIIGGGPAGLAAAAEAGRQGIKNIIILEREQQLGGTLNQCIESGYGVRIFNEELTGPEYVQRFIDMIKEMNIEYKLNTMVLELDNKNTITAVNEEDGIFEIGCKSVILAMGCRERPRGSINIPGGRCAGIYTAGTAQKFVNLEGYMPGKEVVILGSGDIGLIMARRITLEGAKVKAVIELMPYPSGLKRNITQCLDDFNIPLLLSHTVIGINGEERVQGITVAKVDENRNPVEGTEQYIDCDTIFLSVGLLPEDELLKSADIKISRITGGPDVSESLETNVESIFACGNVVYIHDDVEGITLEAYEAGRNSASYVKNL